MYIPLGSEQLCLTKAGLSLLEIVLDSLQLSVYINGQPSSAVKCLPGQILAVPPAYPPEVGLRVLVLGLGSQVIPSLALYLNL